MHRTSIEFRFLAFSLWAAVACSLSGCWWNGDARTASAPTAPPSTYSVGGTISGLTQSGLVLSDGPDSLTVAANATTFVFATSLAAQATYAVAVSTQPAGATCTVTNGSGTIAAAAVTNIQVTCTALTHHLGGTLTGLSAAGLVLANGSDTVSPSVGATSFTFAQPVAEGANYAVTVRTQPAGAICSISGGSGSMGTSDVTAVHVTCAVSSYHVGGTISGLTAFGLVLANGSDTVSPVANATTFTFTQTVVTGGSYSVVVQQPPPGLTCSVGGSFPATMGTADVTNIAVSCAATTTTGLTSIAGKQQCPSDSTRYADGTGAAASLPNLEGMTVDSLGNIYAVGTDTVRKITPAGVVTTFAGQQGHSGSIDGNGSNALFYDPTGIVVDPAANLYVADNLIVRHLTSAADVTTIAGTTSASGFIDGTGSAVEFGQLRDIVRDSNGDYFVSDSGNNVIRKVTVAGVVTTFAGGGSPGGSAVGFVDGQGTAAKFSAPFGLAIDAADSIYVADYNNQAIRKISAAGVVTTLAGGGPSKAGLADGTGSTALFADPRRLAMGAGGVLYVADQNGDLSGASAGGGLSGAIRQVSPTGVVTTVAAQASLHSATGLQLDGGLGAIGTDSSGALYVAYGCAVEKVGP
jgi:serine/threonine protein kinase, bacterial